METFPIAAPPFKGKSRTVAAGNAFEWLRYGWAVFTVNPGVWIGLTIVLVVILLGLQIVPVFGTLAANMLLPLLAAGMLLVCKKANAGEPLDIGDLFAGFKHNTGHLVMLGVLYMAGMLAIFFVVLVLGGGSVAGGLMMGHPAGFGLAFGGMMFAGLLSLLLSIPLVMAIWFAPSLVFFNNMPAVDALKASFDACLKNTLPFLVYGLVVMVLVFFATLPLALGFLVLIPVMAGSVYASYQDIFVAN